MLGFLVGRFSLSHIARREYLHSQTIFYFYLHNQLKFTFALCTLHTKNGVSHQRLFSLCFIKILTASNNTNQNVGLETNRELSALLFVIICQNFWRNSKHSTLDQQKMCVWEYFTLYWISHCYLVNQRAPFHCKVGMGNY